MSKSRPNLFERRAAERNALKKQVDQAMSRADEAERLLNQLATEARDWQDALNGERPSLDDVMEDVSKFLTAP